MIIETMESNAIMRSNQSPKVLSTFAERLAGRKSRSPSPMCSPPIKSTPTSSEPMLHPASLTIGDTLTDLASNTAVRLENIWDEVGYTPEERAGQIVELLDEMKRICDEKIMEEQGVAEQFRNAISDAIEEKKSTCAALKVKNDPIISKTQGEQSLTDELASLEASLENLRSAAAAAKEDLRESQNMLIDIHNALGSQLPKEWEDICSDLTESRRQAFHLEVQEMQELEKTRTKAVLQLLLDCQSLLIELKLGPSQNNELVEIDDVPTDSIDSEQVNLDSQIMGSIIRNDNETHTLQSRFASPNDTGISTTVLDKLTRRLAELSQEKRRRKTYLGELGQAIASLWEKLHVSEEDQRTFSESVRGLGMDTIEQGERELQRLTELKAKMMVNLIKEAREKIRQLCQETYSNETHLDFQAGKVEEESLFNDVLLSEHEEFIHNLQEKADQMRPLLKYIEKREAIIQERMEYEELQKDPDRLQQRGAALTKQLMKEEKMSKRIKKDLPKYTELLTRKMREWEKEHGNAFLYEGKSYLVHINKQEEEWQTYRNREIQNKLKKKQQGMTNDKTVCSKSNFKPLPGKKKPIQGRSISRAAGRAGSRTRPLSDSTRQNQIRSASNELKNAKVASVSRSRRTTNNSC